MRHACQAERHNLLNNIPRSLIVIDFNLETSKRLAIRTLPNCMTDRGGRNYGLDLESCPHSPRRVGPATRLTIRVKQPETEHALQFHCLPVRTLGD